MHNTKLIVLLCSHVVEISPLQLVLPHSNQFPFLPKANSEKKRSKFLKLFIATNAYSREYNKTETVYNIITKQP